MQILELHLKNFGKFTDYHLEFPNHFQVIYGENEYGKSTVYAFIKAMLFGLERGRGRAAGRDEFSRYEPWENPNYYAGMMRFRCGGRTFRLERTFDRYTKNASLICEDDGEELSVEAGDLEMLLEGMTAASFENTAAIGQLTAKPGQGLAAELKNYAANYYETGSCDVNLQGALDYLRERKKQVERKQKSHREERRKRTEKLEVQERYVEMDEERLKTELAETEDELEIMRRKASAQNERRKDRDNRQKADTEKTQEQRKEASKKMGGQQSVYMYCGAALAVISIGIVGYSQWINMGIWLKVLSGSLLAAGTGLAAVGFLLKRKQRKQRQIRMGFSEDEFSKAVYFDESDSRAADLADSMQKLEWEIARIREELKEKQLLKSNLREQLLEAEGSDGAMQKLREKLRALELAELRMKEAAEEMVHSFGERLNAQASRILCEITDGRYSRLLIDESLDMAVLHEGRRIPVERLSRGTLEQVYFSLRMAALQILYEEEIPVILDDAFVFYDEKRLKSVLKWLSGQPRQVIIFSCQQREAAICNSSDGSVHLLHRP